jgi:hypothetical protein
MFDGKLVLVALLATLVVSPSIIGTAYHHHTFLAGASAG